MSSHEQFLKDVEADLSRLNSVLLEVEEDEDFLSDCRNSSEPEYNAAGGAEKTVGDADKASEDADKAAGDSEMAAEDCEKAAKDGDIAAGDSDIATVDTVAVTPDTRSTGISDRRVGDIDRRAGDADRTAGDANNAAGSGKKTAEDIDMSDLTSLLRDHEALLLKIDQVLQKKEEVVVQDDYEKFNSEIAEMEEEENTEEEEEDYFKGMNQFVDSDTLDVEKLYDVLEMNLQYQDFISKLTGEVERRLQKNRDKQKELGDEEDHLFLVSQGLLDKESRRQGSVRSANSKILSLQRFKPPYFSNKYKIGPRLNPDQVALSTNPRYQVYQYESGWGKNDRNTLQECMKNSVIDEKINSEISGEKDLDLYHEELASSSPATLFSTVDIDSWTRLQWEEVVQSMSAVSCVRSGADCANQWKNFLCPGVNKKDWGKEEDLLLEKQVRKHGLNSWQLVASCMGTGRKGWQCLQRYHKIRKKPITTWTVTDDKHITDAVMIYGEASFADLSYYMGDKSSDQCLQRWRYSLRPQIRRGKWTTQEDEEIMDIISEHGFDWQKIKDVQKDRTRAQVRERVRILAAKDRSGSNGGTKHWSVEETFLLMSAVKRHGPKNWSAIRKEFELKYTAPVLFRRWVRVQTLLTGSCKRIMLPWERTVMNELLRPKRYLTKALQEELRDMLPGPEQRGKIEEVLQKCKIQGRTALYKCELKRRVQEIDPTEEEEEDEDIRNVQSLSTDPILGLLRSNAGTIYKKAFEVGNDPEFKMHYTPPSNTSLSAFRTLLVDHLPKLQEQAGLSSTHNSTQHVTLPPELIQNEEFGVLVARFKSMFSWPLIMGETPV